MIETESYEPNEPLRIIRRSELDPIVLPTKQLELVTKTALEYHSSLFHNYEPGFGISPCSDPNDHFYDQVWSRDGAHAIGNYFAVANPSAVVHSLETTFRNQLSDGQLPLKVERVYAYLKMIPGLGNTIPKALFNLTHRQKNGRKERGIYKGGDMSGGEDTVPAIIIAIGELFIASDLGKGFVQTHFEQIQKALDHFRAKIDPIDNLASVGSNPDWAESINRQGKLGTINVWWARSLRLMEFMTKQLGYEPEGKQYQAEFERTKASVLKNLYNQDICYFRTKVGENRIDTVASVFGALYLLPPSQAAEVEETLSCDLRHDSGLVNFCPPYPEKQINWVNKLFGNAGYHNKFVWPWVTGQNIQVKIKIALDHPDLMTRIKYRQEAVDDLVELAELFGHIGGAYEIVRADKPEPASCFWYKPPKNLMGSQVSYMGAYLQLMNLGWIK